MAKIYMICSVRKATNKEKKEIAAYADSLQNKGHEVVCPITDTNQVDDIGLRIVSEHEAEIIWADEIHIIWNPESERSLFDFAQARMAKRFVPDKKIIVVNLERVELTEHKSYTNVLAATHFGLVATDTLEGLKKLMPTQKKRLAKKIVKKSIYWQCPTCATEHFTESEGEKCAHMPVEEKKFVVGDRVTNALELRLCSKTNTSYRFKGKVTRIIGPEPSDEEYERKWLGEKKERLQSHVFVYAVEYQCPKCNKKKSDVYYAPELEKIQKGEKPHGRKKASHRTN